MGEAMIILHPHQHKMVAQSRMTGKRAVLLQSPTGSGKSIMASHIVQSALARGTRTIFTVPRLELLSQMSKNYNDFDIPHTFISSEHDYHGQVNNVIASLPSLHRRLDKISPPKLLIVDEARYGEGAMDDVIAWGKKHGAFILGLDATPWKMSGRGMGCWYDAMVEGPSIKWLIENNYLSRYRAFVPDTLDMTGVRVQAGDYNKKDLAGKMESDRVLVGNVVKHYMTHAMGKRGITFTVSRAHSEIVCAAYNSMGVRAAVIDGNTPAPERKRLAIALATGELLQLVCAELLVFGYDLAAAAGMDVVIQCIGDLQPTMSLAKQMQKWGRDLRYEGPDADPHLIFDHANNIYEHGLPCDERVWTLADRERIGRGKSDEKEIRLRVCPSCFVPSKMRPVCECGYVFPVDAREIEEVEGELKELEQLAIKKEMRMEVGRCKTQDDLEQLSIARNYKRGWVKNQCGFKGIEYSVDRAVHWAKIRAEK